MRRGLAVGSAMVLPCLGGLIERTMRGLGTEMGQRTSGATYLEAGSASDQLVTDARLVNFTALELMGDIDLRYLSSLVQ